LGASGRFYCQGDHLLQHQSADEHLPIAFDILSDLVLNPKFDPGDMEKERSVILEEIKMVEDSGRSGS
jgi:predicted Zn-dependent peptidase